MCVHLLCVYLTRRGSKVLTDDYRRIMLAPPPTRIFPQLNLFLLRSTSWARRRLWWCSNKADRVRLDTDLTGVTRASGRRRSACAQQDKTGLYLKIFAPSTCDHVWSTKRVLIAMFVFHYYSLDSNMLWWFSSLCLLPLRATTCLPLRAECFSLRVFYDQRQMFRLLKVSMSCYLCTDQISSSWFQPISSTDALYSKTSQSLLQIDATRQLLASIPLNCLIDFWEVHLHFCLGR